MKLREGTSPVSVQASKARPDVTCRLCSLRCGVSEGRPGGSRKGPWSLFFFPMEIIEMMNMVIMIVNSDDDKKNSKDKYL